MGRGLVAPQGRSTASEMGVQTEASVSAWCRGTECSGTECSGTECSGTESSMAAIAPESGS